MELIMQIGNKVRGFTLIELMIVLLLVALLAGLVAPVVTRSLDQAKESTLKESLYVMRKALDDYYVDKGYYPDKLVRLTEEKYLRNIPLNPYTQSKDSWQLKYHENGLGIMNIDYQPSKELSSGDF